MKHVVTSYLVTWFGCYKYNQFVSENWEVTLFSSLTCFWLFQLQLFPNDPDLTFFQVSITVFPITNDVALIESILLFSADSFFAYDAIYADFVPQKVRAEDALAEIPKAEETWSYWSGIDALYN